MKVLLINGSPHKEGHCERALGIMEEVFSAEGLSVRKWRITDFLPNGCTACGGCKSGGECVFKDISELSRSFRTAGGLLIASPVYYGSPNGRLIAILDRLFQSTKFDKRMKVGAAFVTARRGGCTASFDVINKYFSISEMPIATSNYWNMMHTGEDAEGERTAKRLAENMAYLIKAINLAKSTLA